MNILTLKKNKEFNFVYRRGKPASSRDMTLICAKGRYGGVRVGFSVSKKVGNSVVRNRTRRRLKEAFRTFLPVLSGNYSLVFVARPTISDTEFLDICLQMQKLLKKAGLLSLKGEKHEKSDIGVH
ncbi:ribonuclease P protein component [Christensenellaceae bacterium]|nr:ribonuclease P protein component [Christensenellaceae bacterium]BDF62513.1 ribonuclease P protein component [Christensenellaceae bacterium]